MNTSSKRDCSSARRKCVRGIQFRKGNNFCCEIAIEWRKNRIVVRITAIEAITVSVKI